MIIRRKVFSLLEVEGEERYFSTTEFLNEETQKEFGLVDIGKKLIKSTKRDLKRNLKRVKNDFTNINVDNEESYKRLYRLQNYKNSKNPTLILN